MGLANLELTVKTGHYKLTREVERSVRMWVGVDTRGMQVGACGEGELNELIMRGTYVGRVGDV